MIKIKDTTERNTFFVPSRHLFVFQMNIYLSSILQMQKVLQQHLRTRQIIRYTWVDQKFWNYSHISLNIRRNYIKLIQSTKQTFPNFTMMFEWRSMQGEMWRHRLMASCNSDPDRKIMEIFLFKRRTTANIYVSFGEFCFWIKTDLT